MLAIIVGLVLILLLHTSDAHEEEATVTTTSSSFLRGQQQRQTSDRIIGGTPAPPNKYPYFASLRRKRSNSHYCGGSLITPTLILSAAHCQSYSSNTDLLPNAVIGRDDFTNMTEGESVPVIEELIHPNYGNVLLSDGVTEGIAPNYDFMLLRLARPVSLPNVQYVQLHNINNGLDYNNMSNQLVSVIGHGYTKANEFSISSQLMEVQLTTISNAQCQSTEEVTNSPWTMYDELVTDQMICALGVGKKDSCQGDSGGPLVIRGGGVNGVDLEIGVVSWGYGCAVE